MIPNQVKKMLDNQHVKYMCINHSPAFTAQETAAAAHISGRNLAKIVMIKADGKLAMVVLPANHHVDFGALRDALGWKNADLANETEFKKQFPECEVGAMPPFGNLYNMPVYVSSWLAMFDQIIFNAGSHSELIQMAYRDFEKLVKPKVIAMGKSGGWKH